MFLLNKLQNRLLEHFQHHSLSNTFQLLGLSEQILKTIMTSYVFQLCLFTWQTFRHESRTEKVFFRYQMMVKNDLSLDSPILYSCLKVPPFANTDWTWPRSHDKIILNLYNSIMPNLHSLCDLFELDFWTVMERRFGPGFGSNWVQRRF